MFVLCVLVTCNRTQIYFRIFFFYDVVKLKNMIRHFYAMLHVSVALNRAFTPSTFSDSVRLLRKLRNGAENTSHASEHVIITSISFFRRRCTGGPTQKG